MGEVELLSFKEGWQLNEKQQLVDFMYILTNDDVIYLSDIKKICDVNIKDDFKLCWGLPNKSFKINISTMKYLLSHKYFIEMGTMPTNVPFINKKKN